MQQVKLNWRGPYRLDRAFEAEAGKDWGIYAICRKWGVAPESVLNIGLAYFQELGQRLKQKKWLNNLRGEVTVRFASIELEKGSKHSRQRSEDIECLLIYYHQPKHNIRCRERYIGRQLEMTNIGRRGPIAAIIRSTDL